MLLGAVRAEDRALDGYRVLVVQQAFVAARPIRAMLEAQGAEIIGPVSTVADALALAASEPIDIAVLELDDRTDTRPLLRLLDAEAVPVISVDGSAHLSGSVTIHGLVERVMARLEPSIAP